MAGIGVHLHVHSAFSFLDGASLPETLVQTAAERGIGVLALTDHHGVSGLVRFLMAARAAGIKGIAGATVELAGYGRLVLLVPEAAAYARLTALLTAAHERSPRRQPAVDWPLLEAWGAGLVALTGGRDGAVVQTWLRAGPAAAEALVRRLQGVFGPANLFLELAPNRLPGDRRIFAGLAELGERTGTPLVAAGDVHYARKQDFPTYDLLTCIRTGTRLEEAHPARRLNAENDLKPWREWEELLGDRPQVLAATRELGERLQPVDGVLLDRRRAPRFAVPAGTSADALLARLAEAGARRRYGHPLPPGLRERLHRELAVIRELGFADYFLVVWDVARFARRQGIRFAGRGSAADSVTAYCLGITGVDAWRRNLLFERFLSRERAETPDIDIDFDARYRDRVADYVRRRYGEAYVAQVATYQTYRARLAVREVGKAMGFPPAELEALARSLPEGALEPLEARWEAVPELRALAEPERLRALLRWAARLEGLPRHLGMHLGGLVVSADPLDTVSPRQPSAKGPRIIQFDKRDVETLGLLKLDLLSLRIFTAVEETERVIRRRRPGFRYDHLPLEDAATYARLRAGEGIGVFQLESPAQRALARRLQPDRWEDLVASLALIRPGPIKGNMVDPFIARRRGEEPVTYPHPALEPILAKTYGVVLFQEQVIAIASALAGFTPGEADLLRRVMTHGRSREEMERLGVAFRRKAEARGVAADVAAAVFAQIAGYASYGFNEAHAAAFAETAYRTAYLWEHFPRDYLIGLLNAEPLGYYPIDVLLVEGRRRGIRILPLDINRSGVGAEPEGPGGIRIGLAFLKGWGRETAERVVAARPPGGYRHPREVERRAGIDRGQLLALVQAGGFDSLSRDRRAWIAALAGENPLGLAFAAPGGSGAPDAAEEVYWDYRHLGFGQHRHLLALYRNRLRQEGYLSAAEAAALEEGRWVRMVAMAVRPHRPPTRSGRVVVFVSLLDESGLLEARLSEAGYQRYGRWLFGDRPPVLAVGGRKEAQGLDIRFLGPWQPAPQEGPSGP
ncbi:Error-prone DNA polymerase [Candidatus Hydrogenisulfobacillus filiaventi]|uniref:DNA-directed DNA polymerase n=1 Tax=Candidatus Hydrogenisulfobacillus filiaventi TaxID=2707344 RepID=A0A6F8ZF48_9FIRM|nr:DNA polymerase III subunit alpha [Bacillota bacterium]CAB1128290.1 Error-prone DNA polymerase [Candidatus Hydrogenisulfobacillus filiaventi]